MNFICYLLASTFYLFIYLFWPMSKFSLALSRPCWMRSTNANFLGFSEQMVHQGNYDHLKGYCPSKRLTLWSHFDYLIKLVWFCNYNIPVYPICWQSAQKQPKFHTCNNRQFEHIWFFIHLGSNDSSFWMTKYLQNNIS